ncbi:hypothetical protein AHF37_03418 [Paragonimus kellicotti]|nr:hypothetical protein AHF37_03418 [Paragonimus kellicotti]
MTFYLRILSAVIFCIITSAVMHIVYKFADKREVARVNTAKWPSRLAEQPFGEIPLSDRPVNLLWFVQVTDLHLSKYQDVSRMSDFRRFCIDVIPLLRPELVSVSGDLTDARSALHITSIQNPEEWIGYEEIVRRSGVLNYTNFFDLRGNHDMFGVVKANHTTDYFRKYGVQGGLHVRSYLHTVRKPFGTTSFVNL